MMHEVNIDRPKSTGNDIVALKTINSQRTLQPRFYSKILAGSESALYPHLELAGMSFINYVWLLWSVKESVFKYLKRTDPASVFSPTKIVIQQIDTGGSTAAAFPGTRWESHYKGAEDWFYTGRVLSGSGLFFFRSKVYADVIATVVCDDENFENMEWGIQLIDDSGYEHQSKAARDFVLHRLHSIFPDEPALFSIGKSTQGHPIVLKGGIEEENIPVSLAHHDRFIAYSFLSAP
ncbi:4'-phosphopantetheinyl transferase family protein [Flavitalea flava]